MPISKINLSASTDGRGVLLAATSTPGTIIHTGSSIATDIDEVWLYISNSNFSEHVVTIEWGGTTNPNDLIVLNVPPYQGLFLAVPGLIIDGNSTPLAIRAYCDTTNKVSVYGYANRISI